MRICFAASMLLSTSLLGCVADEPLAGGPGAQPPIVEREQALAGASDALPCGAATVGDVRLANGHRLTMCVFDNGIETFREIAPIGEAAAVDGLARPACGLDVWLALTGDDVAVPQALVDACPPERVVALGSRVVLSRAVLAPDAAGVAEGTPAARANYCGSGGQASFESSCYQCAPYDDCVDWCVGVFWGWHDRTMSGSSFLGEEGNIAMEKNAACSGKVRVRQYYREDEGDAWETKQDYWVNAGTSATSGFIYHSVAIFGQDYDFRLRANSDGVGVHRHTGYFLDE